MKKKRNIAISILGLLVLWMIVSMLLPSTLKAESKDNRWHAVYTVDHSLKKTWAGELKWEKGNQEILAIHFLENGKVISKINIEDQVDMMKNNKYEFAYLGEEPNKGITYQLFIRWKEGGKEYEETLDFKRVKRLFVIPKIC